MDMFQILRSIYDRSVAIGTAFFGTFCRLRKLIFWWQNFQILIFMFSFYPCNSRTGSRKTSMTQEWLVIESSLTPCWVTFLIFCQLVYNITSHLNDFGLKCLVTVMPKSSVSKIQDYCMKCSHFLNRQWV